MTINSRDKGAVGEREFANWLKEVHGYEEARRGQQRAGGSDSPDILGGPPGVHIEVKRTETFAPYSAYSQAVRDANGRAEPVVFHRYNRGKWMAFLDADTAVRLLKFLPFIVR